MNKALKIWRAAGSLKLTLISFGLMMVLIFFGTLAQVRIGTFAAQDEYFSSFFIYGEPFGFRMPVLPGGFLVGGLWLVNLISAFVFQFRFVKKKTGLLISHAGLILLLIGQFLTQTLARESQMPIEIGHSRNYSEVPREMELVFIDSSHPDFDQVAAVPPSRLRRPGRLETPALPFAIDVKKVFANSRLMMKPAGAEAPATQGAGTQVMVEPLPPVSSDDEANNLSAVIEILEGNRSLGTWLVSGSLGTPQSVAVQGKEYFMSVRPRRIYYPFTLRLNDFRHDIYPGTTIPKNFSSRIHLTHDVTGESREALIYMNNPLRYEGKTFYQASFGKDNTVSVFQVVENPAWITPYVACAMMTAGLAIQFLMHLLSFVQKRRS